MLRSLMEDVVERLLPQFCAVCDREGSVMCDDCVCRIDVSGIFLCPSCHQGSTLGARHTTCVSVLDGVVSVASYASFEVQQMVRLLKYQYIESVGLEMGVIMREFLFRNLIVKSGFNMFGEGAVFVPVPLSRRRFAQRGFNQAELLARGLGQDVQLMLCRNRDTMRQVDLVGEERVENVDGVFICVDPPEADCKISRIGDSRNFSKKPPRTVVLVDDVATTCATLESCAKALRAAGCKSVWAFTFARG